MFVNNLVTRGLGGTLLPTAGLGRLVVVFQVPVFDDVGGHDGPEERLPIGRNGVILACIAGTIFIIDNEID